MGKLAWQVRRSDGRNLIPFAMVEDDRKDFACFDGDDSSGNPSVMIFIPDGSGRSYGFSDFSTWFEAAKADAEDWRKHYGDLR